MKKPARIPRYIERALSTRMTAPFLLSGEIVSSLHDPFLINKLDGFTRTVLAAAEERRSVAIDTDETADALASAAIMRSMLGKLGGVTQSKGQQSLFEAAASREPILLSIRAGAMSLGTAHDRISISARDNQPPYPFPELSLSGIALKVVDAAFLFDSLGFPCDFVAFDLETTGRDPNSDEIIEFGAIKYRNNREVDSFSAFVNPRRPIPEEVVRITGISDERVSDAPVVEAVLPGFVEFCGGLPLVAHNISFDLAFLKRQAALVLGRRIPNDTEDTLSMSRWLHPEAPGHRLGDMVELLGIKLAHWHRAEDDARAAAQLYLKLKSVSEKILRELRIKQFLALATLGIVGSGMPIKGENKVIVTHGLAMALRLFSLRARENGPPPKRAGIPEEIPARLLSLDDAERREAALHVLAGIIENNRESRSQEDRSFFRA